MQGQVKGLFLVRALLLACRCWLPAVSLAGFYPCMHRAREREKERDGGMDGGREGHGGRRRERERKRRRERESKGESSGLLLFLWELQFYQTKTPRHELAAAAVKLLNHVQLFATPWTVALRAPIFIEFPRQEYWSGLPFPSPTLWPYLTLINSLKPPSSNTGTQGIRVST